MTKLSKARTRYHYARLWLAACNHNGSPRAAALAECRNAKAALQHAIVQTHITALRAERDRWKDLAQRQGLDCGASTTHR